MTLPVAFSVWAIVVALAAIAGARLHLGGTHYTCALCVAAALFAFEFFLAAPGVMASAQSFLGGHGRALAPLFPLFALLVYGIAVNGDLKFILAGAAYSVIPALLLASCAGKAPGAWQDYATAILIWIAIWLPPPYRLLYRIFPYPHELQHTLSIVMALSTAVAAFLLVRRMEGVGYSVEWRRGFGPNFAIHFVVFALIAISLGMKMGFLRYAPAFHATDPLIALGILFFTAWPEEFLFRGVLQNALTRSLGNKWAGLIIASVIFGFSHILHAPAPNWKYVLLACIAGLFYGHAWMKSGSLIPGVLVHALVDASWHVFFR
ncbi:MAG TPA: CPBP family intramembrane glutamic endopeptidase [Candidatus Acidoferrales bacterium]|nr:CPBP family intramembrane glutamic endopeptidase [Candidatus Acidoferrales bacterium]